MSLEIIGAESMGVRSLCCHVTLPERRIVIDPGIALGYKRNGLLPHPVQIAVGRRIRNNIISILETATDVVFSHFHGDHVPLENANPYQLSIQDLPPNFGHLHCWSKSDTGLSEAMHKRFQVLTELLGPNLTIAEGLSQGPLSFSHAVPHGAPDSPMGTVMMTRIQMEDAVFVHASDIHLLDDATVTQIIDWAPDIVLAAGPPLYLNRLDRQALNRAWENALRLVHHVEHVILDHHLMRSLEGADWLDTLSMKTGKKVCCAADFMGRPRNLCEAKRSQLYAQKPVPDTWHDDYENGRKEVDL